MKSGQHLIMLENSSPGKPWTSGSSFVMNQLREYGIYVLLLKLIHCLQIFYSLRLACVLLSPTAKYTEYKTSWPPEPIGPKSWKASRGSSQTQLSRPPPGLASQKQPSPSPWSGGAPRLAGRSWSSGSNSTGD